MDETCQNIFNYIKYNKDFAIHYPKKCFSRIARENHLTLEMFFEKLAEIQVVLLKNYAKIDKKGRVISMFELAKEEKIEDLM